MTLDEYEQALKKLGDQALPAAVAECINNVASFAHANQARVLRSKFTLRNQYTERSLRFYKASPKAKIEKINAVAGTVSEYLPLHESGGLRRPKQGRKVPVATMAARGGKAAAVVRKKYRAGSLGENQFVGRPRGNPARPAGVYERYGRGKRLRMIRNLENTALPIKPSGWHTLAMHPYSKREVLEAEFFRQASTALASVGAK